MNKPALKRIKYIEFNEIQLDAPVEIIKGALLIDNKNNRLLLQLKLGNISSHVISSVYITVDLYDDANDEIHNVDAVEHVYLDFNAKPKEVFGEKNPAVVNERTRNTKVTIRKVVFSNGEVWRNENSKIFHKPKQKELSILDGSLLTYLKQKVNSKGYDPGTIQYFPEEINDIWLCTCGRPNNNSDSHCVRCGMDKELIFNYTNENFLRNEYELYLNDLAKEKEEEERKLVVKEEKERIKRKELQVLEEKYKKEEITQKNIKRAKRIRTAKIVLILLIIGTISSYGVMKIMNNIQRDNKYKDLILKYESDQYEEVFRLASELGDYKDSEEILIDARYEYAKLLFELNNFEESKQILKQIDNNPKANDLLNEIIYNEAINKLNSSNYSGALELMITINGYKDSNKLIDTLSVYNLAVAERDNKNYSKSAELFNKITDFGDSKEQLELLQVEKFIDLMKKRFIYEAQEAFKLIENPNEYQHYLESPFFKVEGVWRDVNGNRFEFKLQPNRVLKIKINEEPLIVAEWDATSKIYAFDSQSTNYLIESMSSDKNRMVLYFLHSYEPGEFGYLPLSREE